MRASFPAQAGIQYAAALRFCHDLSWNTGSPAFAGDDSVDAERSELTYAPLRN